MNLRDLKYVIAVAQARNFTRAARIANVSQPALSNQIRKLEAELGTELFERGKNAVLLTPFGERVLAVAREIDVLVGRIGEIAEEFRDIEATPLRLGMTPTLAAYLSRFFLDMVQSLYPAMRLVIVEELPVALGQMVERQALDVALIARKSHATIYGDAAPPAVHFTPLWVEPIFLGLREDHPLGKQARIRAKDVPVDMLIRFPVSFGYDLEADLPEPLPASAERVGIDVRSARFETVCRHVAQSDACTIINAIAALQFRRDNLGLAFVPFDDLGNLRELGAITRPDYARHSVVEAMQQYIQATPPAGTLSMADREKAHGMTVQMLIERQH